MEQPASGHGTSAAAARASQQQQRSGTRRLAVAMSCLVIVFASGAATFGWLERDTEKARYDRNRFFYKQMKKLYGFPGCENSEYFAKQDLCKDQARFDSVLKAFFERAGNEMEDAQKWTLGGSLFFVVTLATSLGYLRFCGMGHVCLGRGSQEVSLGRDSYTCFAGQFFGRAAL